MTNKYRSFIRSSKKQIHSRDDVTNLPLYVTTRAPLVIAAKKDPLRSEMPSGKGKKQS